MTCRLLLRVVAHHRGVVRIGTVRRLTTRQEMRNHHVARLRIAREAVASSRNHRHLAVIRRAVAGKASAR